MHVRRAVTRWLIETDGVRCRRPVAVVRFVFGRTVADGGGSEGGACARAREYHPVVQK